MIHHISIPAQRPVRVARALAELLGGRVTLFPPNPHSYMVRANDAVGTAIEVYPAHSELVPGEDLHPCWFRHRDSRADSPYSAFHAAISVPVELPKIREVAAREQWRAVLCDRDGLFEVVEFWLENHLMIELLTPAMAKRYQMVFQSGHALDALLEVSLADLDTLESGVVAVVG